MLLRLAKENPGTKGTFRLAAGVLFKGHLVATGINSYKTHPVMLQGDYREHQVYLHAEASAIVRATRLLSPKELTKSSLYVVRVKKDLTGRWLEANAMPCKGCFSLIASYGIKQVEWTTDD